jgi:hypothetical protein
MPLSYLASLYKLIKLSSGTHQDDYQSHQQERKIGSYTITSAQA